MPSNEVLFKLMRACIGVETEEELWIFSKEYKEDSVVIERREKLSSILK